MPTAYPTMHTYSGTVFPDMPTAVAMTQLDAIRKAEERIRAQRVHWINQARAAGVTWRQIGDALGLSEAAARHTITRNTTKAGA